MSDKSSGRELNATLPDKELFQLSPFLSDLVGQGTWRETPRTRDNCDVWFETEDDFSPSFQLFRQHFRKMLDDPEDALLALRRLRVRTLLALARADLLERIKPYQVRSRLRALAETMIQGAWWVAEQNMREKNVHPLILERRNIKPPVAICSLSRLGAGEPWYTTGPAPIFVHSRAAEFAPALTEADFEAARRSNKEWLPARDYFHRLASRTMFYLFAPNAAGKGIPHMAEDQYQDGPPLLPGAPVILYSSFEEHFLGLRSVKERLSLLRLRFLVGQEKLGQAVEKAARESLLRTAAELGDRLKPALDSWYRDRALAEGLPLVKGGLLDIERKIRLLQFKHAGRNPDFIVPSPLKALDMLSEAGLVRPDDRLTLSKAYNWQWFVANRLSLLGNRSDISPDAEDFDDLDSRLRLPGAAEKTMAMAREAHTVLAGLLH